MNPVLINRGGPRNPATIKMIFFAAIVNGFECWTIVVKNCDRCDRVADTTCEKWWSRCFGEIGWKDIFYDFHCYVEIGIVHFRRDSEVSAFSFWKCRNLLQRVFSFLIKCNEQIPMEIPHNQYCLIGAVLAKPQFSILFYQNWELSIFGPLSDVLPVRETYYP